MVYYALPGREFDPVALGIHVFDKDMNELWFQSIKLPYEIFLYDLLDFALDNDGNAYVLGKLYADRRVWKKDGNPNYVHQVVGFFNGGSDIREYTIDGGEVFHSDMRIATNMQNKLICAGFYGAKGIRGISGSFFLTIDPESRSVLTSSYEDFDLDLITENLKEGRKQRIENRADRGKSVELQEYDMKDIIPRPDGGTWLVGENVDVNLIRDLRRGRSTLYDFNDIIVVNVSPEGKVLWTKQIAKRQRTRDDQGISSSYAVHWKEDKLYFVFNDHRKNLDYEGDGKLSTFIGDRTGIVTLVELRQNGSAKRHKLFDVVEEDMLIRPRISAQFDSRRSILYGEWRSTKRFMRLTFPPEG